MPSKSGLQIRRALLSVSDKAGLAELGQALHQSGSELVATGKTAQVLREAGLPVTPIEQVSGSPEAFQGRMKTLSFPVCSGILYRRGDSSDEQDLAKLGIVPIDCVVVNFYPFEQAAAQSGISRAELIEQIDIGGPTLVRAAAKNAPDVLVLTDPAQYGQVISELRAGAVSEQTSQACALRAWQRILDYDRAIADRLSGRALSGGRKLRYGENPHQEGYLSVDSDSPIAWDDPLTPAEISFNNVLDFSGAYQLVGDLLEADPGAASVVIVKHNNPCGVARIPFSSPEKLGEAQRTALLRAWEGDPVSAFGGVVVFSHPIQPESAEWLSTKFVELVGAPALRAQSPELVLLLQKRKNLKALRVERFGVLPQELSVNVPGARLLQTSDQGPDPELRSMTRAQFQDTKRALARFAIECARALKSNALAIVREIPGIPGSCQLIGTGQGQPNRVEALEKLALPRAQAVLRETGGRLSEAVLASDAFFPFRDTVDIAARAGIRFIVQPGGSIKDQESIDACDEHGVAMAFTGRRHFRH